jgi:hypothetical protein
MLCERGQHMQHEPVGVGIIATDELRATLHQRGNKGDVAGQAVKFRYNERGFLPAAFLQRGQELQAVGVFLSALASVYSAASWPGPDMSKHGGALGSTDSLPVGRDAIVSDVHAHYARSLKSQPEPWQGSQRLFLSYPEPEQ